MLQTILQTALQTIYPNRCLGCGDVVGNAAGLCGTCWADTPFIGGAVCDSCGVPLPGEDQGDVLACDRCLAHPPPWQRGRAALIYKDLARKLVLGFKHGDRLELADIASLWLTRAATPLLTPTTVIAPIPLHWRRMVRRRYNQSALLVQALVAQTGHESCLDLLRRVHATPSLDGKSKPEREATLLGALHVAPKRAARIRGRSVLLVDDVLTTGATFAAATQACYAAGAQQVDVLALARVTFDA